MTKQVTAKKPVSVNILIALHIFLGVGALFGGGALMIGPDGSVLKMPSDLMEIKMFPDYFIPGLILFLVLGVVPLIIATFLINGREFRPFQFLNIYGDMRSAWTASLYMGFADLIWITVEVYVMQAVAIIHLVYFAIGFILQIVTLLPSVRNYYKLETDRAVA
ncbi:hypothetical protein [Gorillibacterium massiliense]|uniref:hypothetical protein n=1 Tax=Gorillibacterium massiliense TaxID=1280390 RepID=UPI0004B2C201|nr:hypothetical protein [Gorillibacterium massiliense]